MTDQWNDSILGEPLSWLRLLARVGVIQRQLCHWKSHPSVVDNSKKLHSWISFTVEISSTVVVYCLYGLRDRTFEFCNLKTFNIYLTCVWMHSHTYTPHTCSSCTIFHSVREQLWESVLSFHHDFWVPLPEKPSHQTKSWNFLRFPEPRSFINFLSLLEPISSLFDFLRNS